MLPRIVSAIGAALSREEIEAATRVVIPRKNQPVGVYRVLDELTGVLVEYHPYKNTIYTTPSGVIVGSAINTLGQTHAFRWAAGEAAKYIADGTSTKGMRDLGTLGGSNSIATAISADKKVIVGGAGTGGPGRAFRWTVADAAADLESGASTKGMRELGTLGGVASIASQVSAHGDVVYGFAGAPSGYDHAFSWTAETGMVDLGTLGGARSYVLDLSADDSTIVGFASDPSGYDHAYRRVASVGAMQDLGTLGELRSQANAVSGDGQVVVGWFGKGWFIFKAFCWTAATGMVDLGILGGYSGTSVAFAVSGNGLVVGGKAEVAYQQEHAFSWTVETGMVDLGTLGGTNGEVSWVSDKGDMLYGMAQTADAKYRVFRWTVETGMVDLGTLGGEESYIGSVSVDGKIVVGLAQVASGDYHAFRWTPHDAAADLASGATTKGMRDLGTFGGVTSGAAGVAK